MCIRAVKSRRCARIGSNLHDKSQIIQVKDVQREHTAYQRRLVAGHYSGRLCNFWQSSARTYCQTYAKYNEEQWIIIYNLLSCSSVSVFLFLRYIQSGALYSSLALTYLFCLVSRSQPILSVIQLDLLQREQNVIFHSVHCARDLNFPFYVFALYSLDARVIFNFTIAQPRIHAG